MNDETHPTSAPAGIDGPAVTAWFEQHVPDAAPPLRFDRVAGGHSCLTYVVTDAAGAKYVLRRPPMGHILATAHDVAREFRIMGALADSGCPVPTMIGLSADDSVNGAPFYVMSHVEGAVLHSREDAERLLPDDAARRRAGESLLDALVALHDVDPDAVGLGDLSKRSGYVERQLNRWSRQWDAAKTRDLPEMDRMHEWLRAHVPPESAPRIVHGDFRLGNALHRADGSVAAMLDWELCTLGEPLADVSYMLRGWGVRAETAGPDAADPTSAASGFPTADELLARYEQGSGRTLEDLSFWVVFHCFRSASITEGVYRRYIDGKMANDAEDATRYARMVDSLVATGIATLERR